MRLLHTSITVKDMDTSIRFYTENLGLRLVKRLEIPENNAEIAFLEDGETSNQIELTFWRNKREYTEGDQLDHIGLQVNDLDRVVKELRRKGVTVKKEPFSFNNGESRIAFITDPNDIWIELIQRR
ncbi:MAG: VOC family protein [Thaumarchaeota archaeon]|nr:VOC family protein [Nitrososphaerota archaeon]MCL5317433.1 VOC family protein [Nitrososphaerota archaeon]